MPTKLPRIAVIRDQELDEALARVEGILLPERSVAATVHDLAVLGAEALAADAERRRKLRMELEDLVMSGNPPWDPEVLADIDRLAW